MGIDSTDLITALGLMLFFEGAAYALFPQQIKKMLLELMQMPENAVRSVGMTCVLIGIIMVWAVRGH